MSEHGYFLRVWTWDRPWWLLWLVGRWEEKEIRPPSGMPASEVFKLADKLRAAGAGVRVEEEAGILKESNDSLTAQVESLREAIREHQRQSQYDEYERGDAFQPELTIRRDKALYEIARSALTDKEKS